MREIKFKFLMENGEVTKPYYLRELIDSNAYINIEYEYSSKIKQELQYAGLKDKNDIEVYRGDIIEDESGFKYEVIFDNEESRYGAKYKNKIYDMNKKQIIKTKVIGNIYENPELLK